MKKEYIYVADPLGADRQILAQHDIDDDATPDPLDFKYFYLHDRLGSVRLVIDYDAGDVVKYYTYEPFGEVIDSAGSFDNDFLFTGQYFDFEIEEYYLRARQYNPQIARFTSRDPVLGEFEQPLTLHKYLYCYNEPIDYVDLTGARAYYVTFTSTASAGWSGIGQMGFAWDNEGNVAFMVLRGLGAGSPEASMGFSLGITSAKTIYDLEGIGGDVGGSVKTPWGFTAGAEYIFGGSGDAGYHGLEINIGLSLAPAEIHGHITQIALADREMMMDALFESAMNAETYGEGRAALVLADFFN